MFYCSLDIETSGLSPDTSVLLEVAAVVEDTDKPLPLPDLPCWQCVIAHRQVPGEPVALAMNHYLVRRSLANDDCLQPEQVIPALTTFLKAHGLERATVAGKNVAGFDVPFLRRLPGWQEGLFRHRTLDPAVLFWDPATDAMLPDTATCLRRAGLGRDLAAPVAVRAWIEERIRLGKNQRDDPQIVEAEQWIAAVLAEQQREH